MKGIYNIGLSLLLVLAAILCVGYGWERQASRPAQPPGIVAIVAPAPVPVPALPATVAPSQSVLTAAHSTPAYMTTAPARGIYLACYCAECERHRAQHRLQGRMAGAMVTMGYCDTKYDGHARLAHNAPRSGPNHS